MYRIGAPLAIELKTLINIDDYSTHETKFVMEQINSWDEKQVLDFIDTH